MNRKQRRARNSTDHIATASDIPLSPPPDAPKSRDPNTKTLLEIAAERQAELLGGTPSSASSNAATSRSKSKSKGASVRPEDVVQVKVGEDGKLVAADGSMLSTTITGTTTTADDAAPEVESPWLDTLLLASSLSAVHFTLSVLAMHQYAETLQIGPLMQQTLVVAFPALVVLIALFHGHLLPASFTVLSTSAKKWILTLRSLVYVVMANVAGCYLIMLTNDRGYYAVMKNAPSVGTLWVWAILEMGLLGALAGVVGPSVYAWWWGYGFL
jgi:hypothetical protein